MQALSQLSMLSTLVQGLPLAEMKPEIVADNEVPGPEPEGFWGPVHAEVKRMRVSKLTSADLVLENDDD